MQSIDSSFWMLFGVLIGVFLYGRRGKKKTVKLSVTVGDRTESYEGRTPEEVEQLMQIAYTAKCRLTTSEESTNLSSDPIWSREKTLEIGRQG